jgi:cytochrome c oxidase assembly protein subunit 11
MSLARRNRRTAIAASLVIAAMIGLTAASVPLYDLFCRVTGYGGTPRVAGNTVGPTASEEMVTV